MTSADRTAAYEASLAAWAARIAPVSTDAARALGLAVVGLMLGLFAPTVGSMPHPVWLRLCGLESLALRIELSGGALPCEYEWCRAWEPCPHHVTDFAAVRRWAWYAGGKARGYPGLEVIASCLCRACEDEGLLTRGAEGKMKCPRCDGFGDRAEVAGQVVCTTCNGSGWQPSPEPVAPPLLALLLHDAHAVLTELHGNALDLNDLVNEHVEEARAEAHIRQVHDPRE